MGVMGVRVERVRDEQAVVEVGRAEGVGDDRRVGRHGG
jgi:hypothetical protein